MMSRGGMFCPKDRGGCGKLLKWDDGAFCEECMTRAIHQRLKNVVVDKTDNPYSPEELIKCQKKRTGQK